MIASDVNNPNFVGARNPDDALWAEFYDDTVLQTFLSQQEGRPIYHDVVKIRIRVPGNDMTVIDRPMEPQDKIRFPRQWLFYENKASDGAHPGTPLRELPGLTKSVVENLRVAGFHTVEQVSAASDVSMQNLKMAVGMDPLAFRLRCQVFLNAAAENAPLTQMSAELEKRDAEMANLKAQLEAQNAMLAKLIAEKVEAAPAAPEKPNLPPPRAGVLPPKPKPLEEAAA